MQSGGHGRTLAPWSPSCRATSKPMPEPPPVTSAMLSAAGDGGGVG